MAGAAMRSILLLVDHRLAHVVYIGSTLTSPPDALLAAELTRRMFARARAQQLILSSFTPARSVDSASSQL